MLLTLPTDTDPDAARFTLYERILDVVENAAASATSLTIVVDDIQWVDPATSRCLTYLAGTVRKSRVWCVLTLRDSDISNHVRTLIDAVLHGEGTRHLELPSLSACEVTELAREASGETLTSDEAHVLKERTSGNPLFVSEYSQLPRDKHWGKTIPAAVRSVLGRRVASVDPDRSSRRAQHLLSALPLADPSEVLDACTTATKEETAQWSSEGSGALAREPRHRSAFCHRDGAFTLFVIGVLAPPIADAVVPHANSIRQALSRWAAGGTLPNFSPSTDPSTDPERIALTYDEDTAHWLSALADTHDPKRILATGQVMRRPFGS
ncbi:hypothetical protein [Rhodococcus sp. IEGM 1379]|uniref:hypothetical protein n=1 Tax=Rhodococcus sp. IEGM 1379 TaxID=3047086 RepID=UPI0024B65EDC|nr:hypothetical protein [Rhodococcus sp. IEGM 1379]MDI9916604.1 hypothetical protein [Rhodococcus sp. IEGM 1379]